MSSDLSVIRFYSTSQEYGEFSNFAPYPISIRGKKWPSSEHYFQAMKFKDEKLREAIRRTRSPFQAARLGRNRRSKLRRDWESVKVGVMREAIEAKFMQNEELRELLLGTENAKLIEHTDNDSYWGDGGNGTGRNMLGKLLMELRDRLRQDE